MKKLFSFFSLLLILSLAIFPIAALAEGEEADVPSDIVTEQPEGTDPETVAPDILQPETETEATEDSIIAKTWENIIDRLSSSSLWISIGGYAVSTFALYELIRKKFGTVVEAIKDKKDIKTIANTVKEGQAEIKAALEKKMAELAADVQSEKSTVDKLMVILSVFMANAKINEHAKTEILLMLSGVKTYTGNVAEIVEKVTETIEAATAADEKVATPVLDEIAEATTSEAEEIVVGGL